MCGRPLLGCRGRGGGRRVLRLARPPLRGSHPGRSGPVAPCARGGLELGRIPPHHPHKLLLLLLIIIVYLHHILSIIIITTIVTVLSDLLALSSLLVAFFVVRHPRRLLQFQVVSLEIVLHLLLKVRLETLQIGGGLKVLLVMGGHQTQIICLKVSDHPPPGTPVCHEAIIVGLDQPLLEVDTESIDTNVRRLLRKAQSDGNGNTLPINVARVLWLVIMRLH
mmetsp:Transcript_19341/g.42319  ORF Transcript_19341/g.42319 Transcript_19341/m.42319 type:complete len:222 (-) Transcript_19341:695-1360(-)